MKRTTIAQGEPMVTNDATATQKTKASLQKIKTSAQKTKRSTRKTKKSIKTTTKRIRISESERRWRRYLRFEGIDA